MKARATLVAVAAVFALPLALAWMFSSGLLNWLPENSVNYGALLKPPLQLKSYGVMDSTGAALTVDSIAGDWFLVVLSGSACTEPCQHWLQIAERIQIAVGRDMPRVTLALLRPDDDEPVQRGQSWLLPVDSKLIDALRRVTGEPQLDSVLLIVDHQGHVVLLYPPTEGGPGVLSDLKRLLRASAR